MEIKRDIVAFISIVFLLLGALFGVQIMAFIFGNLGPAEAGLDLTDLAFNVSEQIQNNSLVSLQTYSSQANTQMNTVGIAITLLILIALFAVFWSIFIKGGMGGSGKGKGSNFG